MKLDSVLTVAIGRLKSNGKPLSHSAWSQFGWEVYNLLSEYGKVVATTSGVGETSDQLAEDGEETKVYVTLNVPFLQLAAVRSRLAGLLMRYAQTSAVFAVDPFHDPIWATADGRRPDPYDKKVVSAMKDSPEVKCAPDGSTWYQSKNTAGTASSYDTQPGWMRREYSVNRPVR